MASLALLVSAAAIAEPGVTGQPLDQAAALKQSQAAIGRTLADYRFLDPRGEAVNLSRFRGRPLVLSLVYTSCYHTCSVLTNQLARMVKVAQDALGPDSFAVLTIGFDTTNDTPERMASFARARGISLPNWWFLSADSATIEALTQDLGFIFFPSPKGFDHTAQTTIVDREGRVYQQVYGDYLQPPDLVEPLKQLVFGKEAKSNTLSGWINGLRLFCTIYNPNSGRYTFDYSIFFGIFAGLMSLGAVGVFIVRAWLDSRPPRRVA
jgi:protein SCO1/2